MVRVLYYAGVRERVGISETRVERFSGTLGELVKHLEERCGVTVIDASKVDADPLSALIFMVNGRHIAHIGGVEAPVSDGDLVSIFPLVGGG